MDDSLVRRIDALAQTWLSLQSLLEELSDTEWHKPTGCPGWDVQDNVSHISALERWAMGDPPPEHTLPPGLEHVRDGTSAFMELPVDYRRSWTAAQVLEEFCELVPIRLAMLRSSDRPGDEPMPAPFGGEVPYRTLMTLRVFDCYAHEQDIRRATGRSGNLAGQAADLTRRQIVTAWSGLIRSLPELRETAVTLELDGASYLLTEEPEDKAKGGLRLTTTFENAVALACGRTDGEPAKVDVVGDRSLFDALSSRLAFTP